MNGLSILFLDDHLVAVNKPSGLLVHRSAIDRHETEHAMTIVRDQLGRWVYPFHRLDRSTSGVLLFALDRDTARQMTQRFSEGRISKSYLAVVRGFTPEADRIDHPLRERLDRRADPGSTRPQPAKDAVTEYRRLATIELAHAVGPYATARYSLITAAPLTGRPHQIRRHLKHIFHPVIGDTTYGDGRQNEFFRRQFQCRRMLLHAQAIGFMHPATGLPLRIAAPLDPHFAELLRALHWDGVAGI